MQQHRLTVLGERPLIDEYATLAATMGWDVFLKWNGKRPGKKDKGLPNTRRASTRPEIHSPTRLQRNVTVALELTVIDLDAKRSNLLQLDRALGPAIPILSSSVALTVAEQASWIDHPGRLIGIGALPSFLDRPLVEITGSPLTRKESLSAAIAFLETLGKATAFVHDSPGMVLPRIVGMLANEACFAMSEGIASRSDIDTAMKLGTNYPFGPLEWAERIGIPFIHAVVGGLYRSFSEERYRVSPYLQRASILGGFIE